MLEGTNAFAASYYFNYLMFLLQQDHGFSNLNNLTLGAVHGFLYVGASWFAGRFGQRHGYFTSLRIGFGGMGAGVALGWLFPGTIGQIGALLLWTLAMCFTWPMLEALASEREPKDRLPNRIGLYNVIWASTAGLAYFVGGSLFQRLGKESLYWLPLIIHALQWMSLGWLERRHAQNAAMETHPSTAAQITAETAKGDPRITQVFQKLAWIGNPFAYMGMNTIIAVVPSIAEHAGLGIEAAALEKGLDFIPLVRERYHLVCLKSALTQPPVLALLQVLQSRAWAATLAQLPGYSAEGAQSGQVLALRAHLPWWRYRQEKPLTARRT